MKYSIKKSLKGFFLAFKTMLKKTNGNVISYEMPIKEKREMYYLIEKNRNEMKNYVIRYNERIR